MVLYLEKHFQISNIKENEIFVKSVMELKDREALLCRLCILI